MVAKHLFNAVLISTTLFTNANAKVDVLNVTASLCPYNDFCHKNATVPLVNPNREPCCSECSCTEDCWETRNCCPDKANVPKLTSRLVCKPTIVKKRKYKDRESYDGFVDGIKNYLIVDSCPSNVHDFDLHAKCTGNNKTLLEDYIWVGDPSSGTIFQNKYCALCNAVETWRSWDIRTACTYINESYFQNWVGLLSDDCSIINEVPGDMQEIEKKFQCYNPSISRCNQTGLWQHFDKEIADACDTYNLPFFQQIPWDPLNVDVFKNAFCFICNTENVDDAQKICPSRFYHKRQTMYTFSALIDYEKLQPERKQIGACAIEEIHDKYMGRCRKLLCPFGSAASNGKCRAMTEVMNNVGVDLVLDMKIVWNLTTFSPAGKGLYFSRKEGEVISNQVYNDLDLAKCTCCMQELRANNRNVSGQPDLGSLIVVSTTSNCQLRQVQYKTDNLVAKTVNVNLKGRGLLALAVSYNDNIQLREITYEYVLYKYSITGICRSNVRLPHAFCPGIELVYSEVKSQRNKKVKELLVPLFNRIKNLNDSATVFICKKDYFKLMAQASIATIYQGTSNLIFMAMAMPIWV